jgi:hypothetical protein
MFQPFPISGFKHGLEEGVQPWLSPADAFSAMDNCFLRRGVLQKRKGYSELGQLVHQETEDLGAAGSTNYSGTTSYIPIQPGTISITDDTQTITDNGSGVLSGDGSGTINYTTGEYDITFGSSTSGDVEMVVNQYYDGLTFGIFCYETGDFFTKNELIVSTQDRLNRWDFTNERFEDLVGSDLFVGATAGFYFGLNAQNKLFLTNRANSIPPYYWDGTSLTEMTVDLDGNASNDVGGVTCMVYFKARLILLGTYEDSSRQNQRARWPAASGGGYSDWTNDGYVDAPTSDYILSAEILNDEVIVFFSNSIWKLVYTANATLPFRWEQLSDDYGFRHYSSPVKHNNQIFNVADDSIVAVDGIRVYAIDQKIPDYARDSNDTTPLSRMQFLKDREFDQMRFDVGSSSAVFNYREGNWSKFDCTYTAAVPYYSKKATNSTILPELYGMVLSTDGLVQKFNDGDDDDGSEIIFRVKTSRWNPYIKKGQKARLGWVDFLVDRDSDISFTVYFYLDFEPVSYLNKTLTCDSWEGTEDKVWLRVDCNAVGNSHRLKLYHSATDQLLKIHAIVPWFQTAGELRPDYGKHISQIVTLGGEGTTIDDEEVIW